MKSLASEPGLTFQNCYYSLIFYTLKSKLSITLEYLCISMAPEIQSNLSVQTPLYYGQFPMSQQNSHTFSLKNPLWYMYRLPLIRTTDTKSQPQRVNLYKLNFFITDTAVTGDQVNPESWSGESAWGKSHLADELCKVI